MVQNGYKIASVNSAQIYREVRVLALTEIVYMHRFIKQLLKIFISKLWEKKKYFFTL